MIYGLLLAAGQSQRMGQAKQLLEWRGGPLVRHIASQALASKLAGLVVVLGAEARAVEAALAGLPVRLVENEGYAKGQAGSLAIGLGALPDDCTAVLVLLCDQPLVSPELINLLIDAYAAQPELIALIPEYQGQRGNPVILSAELFEELQRLEGDSGARGVLSRYGARVRRIELDDPAITTDIDTPEAYQRLYSETGR